MILFDWNYLLICCRWVKNRVFFLYFKKYSENIKSDGLGFNVLNIKRYVIWVKIILKLEMVLVIEVRFMVWFLDVLKIEGGIIECFDKCKNFV